MTRRYSITYLIGQAFKGLFRNGVMSLASIAVLTSCLIVMGSFSLLVYNINYNVADIGAFNNIVVFVEKGRDEYQITDISKSIKAMDGVRSVVFTSKDQVLAEEREKFADYPYIFSMIDETNNPYQDSFVVTYDDSAQVSTLQYLIEHLDGVEQVNCRADIAQNIESVKSGVILVFTWFLILLFVVSVFVIINTVKLSVFTRRQEISIMRYVGATNWFVTFPFVVEGVLIGLISAGLAYLLQFYLYRYVAEVVLTDYKMLSIAPFSGVWPYVAGGFILVGVITGVIGSAISLRRYLKA